MASAHRVMIGFGAKLVCLAPKVAALLILLIPRALL
jgi:hypothetical protein